MTSRHTGLARTKALWRSGPFARLWFGTILSALADGAFMILLAWFIVDATGSEAVLGMTLVCFSLPRVLFMLAGGVLADRWSRKWILLLSMLARSLILILFSGLLATGTASGMPESVYAVALLFGTVDAFFWPARSSILPSIVPRDQLPAANSMMEISQQISMVCGPLAAALLMRTESYPLMFASLAFFFAAGALVLSSLHTLPYRGTGGDALDHSDHPGPASFLRDIGNGIRYCLSVPILCIIFGTSLTVNMVLSGPINMGLPLLVKDLGWDGSDYGTLGMMMGVGTIAGGLIAVLCNGLRGRFLLIPFLLCLGGAATGSLYFMESLPFGLVSMSLLGMVISSTNVPLLTYMQTITPGDLLGRVMSLLSLMSIGMGPVSYTVCSLLLENRLITPAFLMLAGGICMALLSLSLYLFRDYREAERHPDWASAASGVSGQSTTLSS